MSNIWDRTTAFIGAHRRDLTVIALLGIALPSAASAIVEPLGAASDQTTRVMVTIIGIAAILMTMWGQLGLTAMTLADGGGVGRAMATASARFLPLLGAVIPLGLGLVLLGLPIFLILAAAGVDFSQMSTPGYTPPVSPATGLLLFVYLVILLPVVLVLAARMLLVNPAVIGDRLSFGAIARSWNLTRGLTFKLIGVLLLYVVIVVVAMLATQTVVGVITRLLFSAEGPVNASTVITAIAVALVTTLFSVLSTVFVAKLYRAVVGAESSGT
ncbi:hypothetical protein D1610_04510 [Sphingomonas gilva]|uniref:DUF7847 domain-containing protein n=2 Tax=Sphingomonas gilva TaxID=2305907 RepID=A0A396RS70_9SPHN|nr:hypothetical protein D1610_04510 [Sphingomonas gilva]